jgi:hypothetical protein
MSRSYVVFLTGLSSFLALTLLGLLDIRRGFLFAGYPVRTPFLVLIPAHGLMLAAGLAGMTAFYAGVKRTETRSPHAARHASQLAALIFALLLADLFAYRGVAAVRSLDAGGVNADWLQAFGAASWARPAAQATSFLFTVWHATMLGILLSGLALVTLPASLTRYHGRTGFAGSLLGALFAHGCCD